MSQGRIFVIEGTDGAGKGTQARLLTELLEAKGFPVATLDFPRYGHPSAHLVESYLNGDYGTMADVTPQAASILFAVDRFAAANEIRSQLERGSIIIANRYSSSNMGHQAGKIADLNERARFLDWLQELEHTYLKIPRPDRVFLLYLDADEAQRRVDLKEKREYTRGKKRDIAEEDTDHQRKSAEAYLWTAKRYGWDIIDASGTEAEVHSRLLKQILPLLD
ncbi:MAG: Thymidylate kinase [candidate division WS6 bacterium OLB20]|uniref:Thymidylate kinase n=1 Tax=candidate division WS6 bacterium OLB20 TaxID=1617426 RepID=A0A136LVQ0_9BACT|nr:MAG: Thymidylate kinase [candidate division WS6 bacterium OLB20]